MPQGADSKWAILKAPSSVPTGKKHPLIHVYTSQHNSSYVDLWQIIALILLEFTKMCSVAAKTTQGKKCYDIFLAPLLQTLKKSARKALCT